MIFAPKLPIMTPVAKIARKNPWQWAFFLLLAAGATAAAWFIAANQQSRAHSPASGSFRFADAVPDKMPETLVGGLLLLSAEQMAMTPDADGFQFPCGAPQGAMTYNAQAYGSPNEQRGGKHTGDDINGIGGENSDLGEAVCAAGRGLVVYSGKPSPDWGNVVILAHRLPGDDRIYQTLYAHLNERCVRTGETVARGERLGSIGTADGAYWAHLHFEVIASRAVEAGMPGYGAEGRMLNRLDPTAFIRRHPAPSGPDAYMEIRRLLYRETSYRELPSSIPLPEGAIRINPSQFH